MRVPVNMKSTSWSRRFVAAIAAVLVAVGVSQPAVVHAQQADAAKAPLAFEVATVKPVDTSKPSTLEIRVYPGGRLVIHGYPVRWLIATAFDLPVSLNPSNGELVIGKELAGREKWIDQLRFDIEGKPPEEFRNSMPDGEYSNFSIQDPRVRSMLQALLIERFHLKFHKESQPGTVYLLELGKGPLRLERAELSLYTRSEDGTVAPSHAYPTGDMGVRGGGHVNLHQTSMHQLASELSMVQQAPVIDQTGLPDFYNFKSQTVVTDEDIKGGGAMQMLVEAVPEMGLKLVKTQGAVKKFVVDDVEPPTAN
jgi:uncharacterized protein (TIGR03435 family)